MIALLRWTNGRSDRAGLVPFAGFGAGLLMVSLLIAVVRAGLPLAGHHSGMSFNAPDVPQASSPVASITADERPAGGAGEARTPTPFTITVAPTAIPVDQGQADAPEAAGEDPPAFDDLVKEIWERVDRPVAEGAADRAWVWGAEPLTPPVQEPYEDSPGGTRLVQYFDHARLEVTNPSKPSDSAWRLTSGLLVLELVTGRIQTGTESRETREPAQLDIIGEGDTPEVPNYAALEPLRDVDPLEVGDPIIWRLDGSANVSTEPVLGMRGIDVAVVDDVTGHSIAGPFWDYMLSTGTIWDGDGFDDGRLFRDPYFATGHPIMEPYWIERVDGSVRGDVLVQCFERRCLIYGPEQGAEWRVTSSVVGRHYLSWRYGDQDIVASSPVGR